MFGPRLLNGVGLQDVAKNQFRLETILHGDPGASMTASRPGSASRIRELGEVGEGCAWWKVKHLHDSVHVVQKIVGGLRSWVWYSRNTFRNPYSGAHTLRSRCNVCKKWLMAGGGARGWRAAWLVASASWLHCTARTALHCAGLGGGTERGSATRGGRGDEWTRWTRAMTEALCAPSRNEKMQE